MPAAKATSAVAIATRQSAVAAKSSYIRGMRTAAARIAAITTLIVQVKFSNRGSRELASATSTYTAINRIAPTVAMIVAMPAQLRHTAMAMRAMVGVSAMVVATSPGRSIRRLNRSLVGPATRIRAHENA